MRRNEYEYSGRGWGGDGVGREHEPIRLFSRRVREEEGRRVRGGRGGRGGRGEVVMVCEEARKIPPLLGRGRTGVWGGTRLRACYWLKRVLGRVCGGEPCHVSL